MHRQPHSSRYRGVQKASATISTVISTCRPNLGVLGAEKKNNSCVLSGINIDSLRYTLGKVLGQGSFGVVYLCKSKATKEELTAIRCWGIE
eukprot:428189-Amphidinium_carterae.1